MFTRNLHSEVAAALSRSPVTLLTGARQVGKSTLARMFVDQGVLDRYSTLDDLSTLDAARSDPAGFVSGIDGPVVIDEVQLEPRLFRAIKAEVDRDRRPGRFLLTGSADLSVLPAASDALVGRMETLTLWPLTQGEIRGVRDGFLDRVLDPGERWSRPGDIRLDRAGLARAICAGGYPEPLLREPADREPWYRSYIELVVRRDVAERTDIAGLAALPRLLSLLASRTATLVNLAEVARALEMPATTVRRYVAILEAAMLVRMLPAFAGDLARRVVRSPKAVVIDTGLAATLAGYDEVRLQSDPIQFGRLTETFVVNELERQRGWAATRTRLMHARTAAGREVDVVIESADGRVSGVEVKTSRTVAASDFAGLKTLREAVGPRFVHGVVVHTGPEAIPFGPGLWALPIDRVWTRQADA